MTRKPRHPHLDDLVPDGELWERVAQAVEPLHARPYRKSERPLKQPSSEPGTRSALATLAPPSSAAAEPPALTGLERRLAQKLLRGQVQYEAKLDLHGLGAGEARTRLATFLKAARSKNRRLVLVVTGKGASPFARHTLHGDSHYHAPERQGRLRRLVSDWLHEPEFRVHISGFQPAHPKHGGGGAYYVRLRRSAAGAR